MAVDIEFDDGSVIKVSSEEFAPFSMAPAGLEDRLMEFMATIPLGGFSRVVGAGFLDAIRGIQGCRSAFGGPWGDHREVGLYMPDYSLDDPAGNGLFLVNGSESRICFGGVGQAYPKTERMVTAHDHHFTYHLPGVLPSEIDLDSLREGITFVFTPFGLCRYSAKPKGRPDRSYWISELRPESVTMHDVLLLGGRSYHMDWLPSVELEHPFFAQGEEFTHFATVFPNRWMDVFRQRKGDAFFFGEEILKFAHIAKVVYEGRPMPAPAKGQSIRV